MMLSPHAGSVQLVLHPAVSVGVTAGLPADAWGAASHASWWVPKVSWKPSPQQLTMQSERQSPWSSFLLAPVEPLSHSSPGSMMPLPQVWNRHVDEQPGVPSQSSTLVRTLPSPHLASLHIDVHAPVSELRPMPRSHSSPSAVWMMPSPQVLDTQPLVQWASVLGLPASHASTCSGPIMLVRLSPHTLRWHA